MYWMRQSRTQRMRSAQENKFTEGCRRTRHPVNRIKGVIMEEKVGIRINKYLSEAGVCSRREADRLVEILERYVYMYEHLDDRFKKT